MVTRLHKNELEEAICVFRRIWFRIKKYVFEDKFESLKAIFSDAKNHLGEYHLAQVMLREQTTMTSF